MNYPQTASRRRSKLPISLAIVILLGLPATGQAEDVGLTSYFFPADPEYLLVSVHKTWTDGSFEPPRTRSNKLRVFGDGHVEMAPAPDWLEAGEAVLEYVALEQLLHSLDVLLDFAAQRVEAPVSDTDSFIELRLESYSSADRNQVIDDPHLLATRNLDPALAELAVLEKWLTLRAADGPVWVTGNPWPPICQPEHRRKLGLSVLEPVWCSPPFFRKPESGPFSDDREAVRERLRQRLRTLPRGLQQPGSDGEQEGVDLRPSPSSRPGACRPPAAR